MRRSALITFCTVVSILAAFGVAPVAQGAEDYFLQIDSNPPIQGESLDAAFPDAIEIKSFHWSANNGVTIPGAGLGGRGTHLDLLTVQKRVDSASPALFLVCATRREIPSMKLTVRRAGADPFVYLQYRFTHVVVSSVSPSGDGDAMRETVTFAYGALTQQYKQQTATGTDSPVFESGWNQLLRQIEPVPPLSF
jgi:type VI secretion system secreted protein Hcp